MHVIYQGYFTLSQTFHEKKSILLQLYGQQCIFIAWYVWFIYVDLCIMINEYCFNRQEQCSVLVELMKEYQILKNSISSITESAEPVVEIDSVLKDHEETRRSLSKVRSNKAFMFYLMSLLCIHIFIVYYYCLNYVHQNAFKKLLFCSIYSMRH